MPVNNITYKQDMLTFTENHLTMHSHKNHCFSLVEETKVPRENWPVASHWQTLSHKVEAITPHHEWDSNLQL
jgi:hypothetical protein